MEVHLPADKEARLRQFEEAVEAVEVGRTSARRGDLLEHDSVVERIEQILRS